MKNFKRLLFTGLAAALVISTVGCGNKKPVETEEDKYEYIAKTNLITLESSKDSRVDLMDADKDFVRYLEYVWDDNYNITGIVYHEKSLISDEHKQKELKVPSSDEGREGFYPDRGVVDKDGNIRIIFNCYTEDSEKTVMDSYDKDGNFVDSIDLTETKASLDLQYISRIVVDKDGNIFCSFDNTIASIDANGKPGMKITVDGWVDSLVAGKDGEVYASFYDYASGDPKVVVKKVDMASKSLVDTKISIMSSSSRSWLACDESHLFSYTELNCHVTDINSGEEEALWSWMDIDYLNAYPEAIWKNDDGSYCFVNRNYELENINQIEIVTVKKELVTAENRKEKIVFGVRSYLDSNVMNAISKFNKTNGKYKIVPKLYYEEFGYENADAMLKADIAAGKVDFVNLDQYDSNLANKKSFEDLTPYFDKDPDFKKEDMFENILEASKVDGKMYFISPAFSITTMIGNADIIGSGETWTIDDFVKLREKYPDSEFMTYATKSSILSYLLIYGTGDFVDLKTNTCDFNNDSFKKILEMANTFPEEIDYNDYNDWDLIDKGNVFVTMIYLSDLDSITIYDKLFKDKANIIGFPTNTGCGHSIAFNNYYSICSKSNNKEGAWEFIKSLFSDDQFENLRYANGFPIKKKQFEMVMNNIINSEGGGGAVSMGNGSMTIELSTPDKAAVERVRKIIEKANSMVVYDEKLFEIVFEEAEPYFKGSKSLDDTCDSIQKRINLYLSETK